MSFSDLLKEFSVVAQKVVEAKAAMDAANAAASMAASNWFER